MPVSDVNFLVGENSSGKTSILSLLKLMSGERLLFDDQFGTEDLNLGTTSLAPTRTNWNAEARQPEQRLVAVS